MLVIVYSDVQVQGGHAHSVQLTPINIFVCGRRARLSDDCPQVLVRQEVVARQRRSALALAGVAREEAHPAVVAVRAHGLLALEVVGRRAAAAAVEDADRRVHRRAIAVPTARAHLVRALVRLQAAVNVAATPLVARQAVVSGLVAAGACRAWPAPPSPRRPSPLP